MTYHKPQPALCARRSAAVLAFVKAYWAENGFSPSYDDIADALSTSKSQVSKVLAELEQKGLITRTDSKSRNVVITGSNPLVGTVRSLVLQYGAAAVVAEIQRQEGV